MASSPFRGDDDVHEERLLEAQRELGDIDREVARLKAVVARRRAVEAEVRRLRQRVGAQRALPLLDRLSVAAPCHAAWESMEGDERQRHCAQCDKTVYNLSALPRDEAEAFMAARLAGDVCVRFYQRADGTVLTADCPVGVRRRRVRRVVAAVVGTGAMAVAGAMSLVQGKPGLDVGRVGVEGSTLQGDRGEVTMGEMTVAPSLHDEPAPPHPASPPRPAKGAPEARDENPPPRLRMGKPIARDTRGHDEGR